MSYMKGLGYVYRAVVDAHGASASCVLEYLVVHVGQLVKDFLRSGFSVEKEIDVTVYRLRAFYKSVSSEILGDLQGYRLRRLFQTGGKLEAGQSDVSHAGVGNVLQQSADFVGAYAVEAQHGCDITFKFHNESSITFF